MAVHVVNIARHLYPRAHRRPSNQPHRGAAAVERAPGRCDGSAGLGAPSQRLCVQV